jgi:glycosyltransferase involved in cell wall biosynthesis
MSDTGLTLRFAIALQTPRDEQSAVYIGYQSLAQGLERLNHSVTIVAPSDFPRVARLSGRWTPLFYPLALASWLGGRRDTFDLVLFHSYSGWVASLVGRGRPALVMFHGIEPLYHRELRAEAQRSGRPLTWRYRFLQEVFMPFVLGVACRRALGVACLNQSEAAYLKRRGWVSDSNLHVLAHGVSPEFFVSSRPRRPLQTLLFVGQWLPMKGVQYLQDAAAVLLARYADMRLVCAGTLAPAAQVIAHFPEALRNRVTVLPRVDQASLAQLYRNADVFVFPSLYEGFSRAIVEAMASRLPIVCTSVGVAADALRHEHSALIVPPHDAGALVAAVERLRADADFADRLANGAAEAARHYTLAEVSHRTIDVVIDAARGRR